ncbi:MAG: hypothetical protein PHN72_02600 [Bacilli bacterium]|nr:hypothetical protein [Bacilli bacterium]
MKKKIIIGIVALIIVGLSLLVFFLVQKQNVKEENVEGQKFKEEYAAYNNQKSKSGKQYKKVDMEEDNRFVYADMDQIKKVIKGTGVIYFGFPECPWCRNAVSVLNDAAKQTDLSHIYYLNVFDMRDEKKLDENGNIVTTKEGTKEYKELLELLHDALPEYDGLKDPNIKRIYVPLVITFKDGKVIDTHLSTVDSQKDPYENLTEDQYKELLKKYTDAFTKIGGVCTDAC